MPPEIVARLPDDTLTALVQSVWWAKGAVMTLCGMPPATIARLSDHALHALARAAAQDGDGAAQTLNVMIETMRSDHLDARAGAIRVACAIIGVASDILPGDALIACAQTMPQEALGRTDVINALLARVRADSAATPLLDALNKRRSPSDAPLPRTPCSMGRDVE